MKKHLVGTMILAATVCSGVGARAADSTERKAITSSSRTRGLGRATIPLLRRQKSTSGPEVLDRLRASTQLEAWGNATRSQERGALRFEAKGAYLQVDETGTVGQFYAAANPDPAVALAERRSDAELTATARAFVETRLAPAVGIDTAELFPLSVRHQTFTAINRSNSKATKKHVSSEVVFGRKIGGVPVVGPGSKVFVEFSSKGNLQGFRYDWAAFSASPEEIAIAPLTTILQRANSNTRAKAAKIDLYDRFECGYYDSGEGQADGLLQSACLVQLVTRDAAGGIVDSVEEIIPAGATVKPDAKWPLASRLAGVLELGEPPPPAGPQRQ